MPGRDPVEHTPVLAILVLLSFGDGLPVAFGQAEAKPGVVDVERTQPVGQRIGNQPLWIQRDLHDGSLIAGAGQLEAAHLLNGHTAEHGESL